MATYWYFRAFDEEMGPVPFAELVEMVRSGAINEDDPIRSDWEEKWQRARHVPGLFYMAQREPLPRARDAVLDPIFGDDDEDFSDEEKELLGEPSETADSEAASESEAEPWRPPWLEQMLNFREGWSAGHPSAGGAVIKGNATNAGASGGISSLAAQAMDQLDNRNGPPIGRMARLGWRLRRFFAAATSPKTIGLVLRFGAALAAANFVALGVDRWAAQEAMRFPGDNASGQTRFPLLGTCSSEEYFLLISASMILAGMLAYGAVFLLEAYAEDS